MAKLGFVFSSYEPLLKTRANWLCSSKNIWQATAPNTDMPIEGRQNAML